MQKVALAQQDALFPYRLLAGAVWAVQPHLGGLDGPPVLALVAVVVQQVQQAPAQLPVLADQAVNLPGVVCHVHMQDLVGEQVLELLLHHLQIRNMAGLMHLPCHVQCLPSVLIPESRQVMALHAQEYELEDFKEDKCSGRAAGGGV